MDSELGISHISYYVGRRTETGGLFSVEIVDSVNFSEFGILIVVDSMLYHGNTVAQRDLFARLDCYSGSLLSSDKIKELKVFFSGTLSVNGNTYTSSDEIHSLFDQGSNGLFLRIAFDRAQARFWRTPDAAFEGFFRFEVLTYDLAPEVLVGESNTIKVFL